MMRRRSAIMALLAAIISAATAQNASSGSSQTCEALSVDNISPLVVKAEYAVRGRLLARASSRLLRPSQARSGQVGSGQAKPGQVSSRSLVVPSKGA